MTLPSAGRGAAQGERAVVVDGCRTPFLRSGTDFTFLWASDLGGMAGGGVLPGTGVYGWGVDYVVMGTVIQDMFTSNLAREVALTTGLPKNVPAHTVTMACISSNQALATVVEKIRSGEARIAVAGGAETCSDIPIRFRRAMRKRLIAAQKYKKPTDWLKFLFGLRPSLVLPEVPAISEFSTGLTMGQSCDRLTSLTGVTRKEQDEFALRSHKAAAEATQAGRLAQEIEPAVIPPKFKPIAADNGFRADTTLAKLGTLPAAFNRKFGTATAGNSSFLTDGGSALLVMSETRARELGYAAKGLVRSYAFVGCDNLDELLLGPAHAIPRALAAAGLKLSDIDVFEIHEAFAGSTLAVRNAIASPKLAKDLLGLDAPLGEIPMDKMNADGGSLSLGHPFGATGARLVMATCRRLAATGGKFGLLAACAAGGLGHAMVLERIETR